MKCHFIWFSPATPAQEKPRLRSLSSRGDTDYGFEAIDTLLKGFALKELGR